jgi:glycosyltransferase involved in cell wall biosynthesis
VKKKVVFLGFNSFLEHKRGVENVIEFQASVLDDWCYYIHWGNVLKVYKYKSFLCISIPIRSIWKFVIISLVVRQIAKKSKERIFIHSHNTLMSLFICRLTDLFTVHDGLFYQQSAQGCGRLKKCAFYVMEKWLYKRCRKVHFISDFTKSQSLYPSSLNNNVKIYNTSNFEIPVANFVPNYQTLCEKYPFLVDEKYCFIVRSLEERARIDLVIEVAQKYRDFLFVVAGKGPLLSSLQTDIERKQINNVKLLGFVPDDDLFQLYAFANFVMVPAEYGEGFGLPIIEAYLFNKPVIASKRCAIPEVCINDNYLFDNDVESILCAIEYCKTHGKENFFEYYQNHFSQKIITEQYRQLYKECI